MEPLYKQHCEECRLGSPLVTPQQSHELMLKVPAWRKEFQAGVEQLIRDFYFKEFKDAFEFTHKLAVLSQRENHHPAIHTEWGKVTVHWWTRKVNGLHKNDFIMAAKTDMLAKLSQQAALQNNKRTS